MDVRSASAQPARDNSAHDLARAATAPLSASTDRSQSAGRFDDAPADAATLLKRRRDSEITRAFGIRTYLWIAAGLSLSFLFALPAASSPISSWAGPAAYLWLPRLFFLIAFASASLIQKHVNQMTELTAALAFLTYSALNGYIYAGLFGAFAPSAVAYAFALTALLFAASAALAWSRDIDLLRLRSFAIVALIAAVLWLLSNFLSHADRDHWAASYLALILFASLTLYHAGDLRSLAIDTEEDDLESRRRASIFGALTIYLDFVLLPSFVLRTFDRWTDTKQPIY